MEIKTDIYLISTAAASLLMLFLAIVIISLKRKNRKPNILFSIFLVNVVFSIFSFGILINSGLYLYFPHLIRLSTLSLTTICPLFYFYVKCLINDDYKFSRTTILHAIPLIAAFIYFLPFFVKSGEYKIEYLESWLNGKNSQELTKHYILIILIMVQMIVYLVQVFRMMRAYEKPIKEIYSSIEKITLNWLRYFLYSYIIMLVVLGFFYIAIIYIFPAVKIYKLIPLSISIAILFLAYRVLIQPEILIGRNIKGFSEETNKNCQDKYSDRDTGKYIPILRQLMESDKLYRNPSLSLNDLSEELDIGRNFLSYIINKNFKVNFYDFVNKYRIDEIKNRLEENPENKMNLIHIAMDAGFNSKTTFNVMFKKFTKMTPTQYKKKIIQE